MAARNVRYGYTLGGGEAGGGRKGVGGREGGREGGGLTPAGNGNHMVSAKLNVRWPSLAATSSCTKAPHALYRHSSTGR